MFNVYQRRSGQVLVNLFKHAFEWTKVCNLVTFKELLAQI